ncbi:hypothetical protein BU25DRAFT_487094 [Macroventuria anomochaeta]|uniref:Uncharacterized protein n=1 Tax=Macroventuria anomochaeta TaxID=301207 RepID=A0ACB6SF95_9PLEO|nr:uncharacterized protein BU25DRAFT_487094 [Macroventuria anomochaeta]KAF2632638.1 hypothetical protein BU25DRAFT_487094 [Macroventuria anomochaeta]
MIRKLRELHFDALWAQAETNIGGLCGERVNTITVTGLIHSKTTSQPPSDHPINTPPELPRTPQQQSIMPSSYASYYQEKGSYAPRPSTSSTSASSNYAQSAHSSRSYGSKPATVVIHNGGGPKYDPNNSGSAQNSGYYP